MNELPQPAFPSTPQGMDQATFQSILGDHANWVLSGGKEGRRANFKDADLRFIDFAEAQLHQASFRNADLRGCDLTGAQLQEADFTEAKLGSANLTGVNLGRANFASANLERAILDGANLAYANLLNANITEASFRNTLMEKATLRQAIATRALFEETDLTDAMARESQMQSAKFIRARLSRADFRDSKLDQAQFIGVVFEQTQFKGASFSEVGFGQSDFGEALEISQEYKAAAHQEETDRLSRQRAKLDRDRQGISSERQELETAKRLFEQEKEAFSGIHETEERFGRQLYSAAKQLKAAMLLWLLVLLIVAGGLGLAVISLDPQTLNTAEIGLVLGIAGFLFLLSLFTFARTAMLGRRVKDQIALRERKLSLPHTGQNVDPTPLPVEPLLPNAMPALSDEAPPLDLPSSDKKRGLFKKKA